MIKTLPIDSIEVQDRWRDAGDVTEMAASIDRLGLLHPITVYFIKGGCPERGYKDENILVAGLQRLTACKQLGWTEIECNVVALFDIDIELAEIDENLIRQDLTALQRAEQLGRREWIFGQKGLSQETGNIVSTLGGRGNVGFAKDASEAIGRTKQSINQHLAVVKGVPQKLRDELRGTEAEDNLSELRALAREKNPAIQKRAVKKYKTGEVESIRDALKAKRRNRPRHERVAEIKHFTEQRYRASQIADEIGTSVDNVRRIAGEEGIILPDAATGREHHIDTARVVRVTVNDLWASAPSLELVFKGGITGISPKEAGELLELMESPLRAINRLKSKLKELRDSVQGESS